MIKNIWIFSFVVITLMMGCSVPSALLNTVNQRFPNHSGTATKVAKGVTHYAWLGRDTILRRNQSINIVDIDLNKADVTFDFAWFNDNDHPRNTVSEVAHQAGAFAAVNSGYFEILENGTHVTFHKSKGKVNQKVTIPKDHIRYWKHQAAFIQTGPKNISFIQGDQELYEKLPFENIISSAPLLISDNVPVGKYFIKNKTGDKSKLEGENPERHQAGLGPRVAYATTHHNHLLLVAIDGRSPRAEGVNAEELTDLLHNYCNANAAINMDGGGSVAMYVASAKGIVNYPSDNRRSDINYFEHFGQRKVGMALLVIPTNEKIQKKLKGTNIKTDDQAKDYIDLPRRN
jgi:hypothetical protein